MKFTTLLDYEIQLINLLRSVERPIVKGKPIDFVFLENTSETKTKKTKKKGKK